jgi:hypothetical protein
MPEQGQTIVTKEDDVYTSDSNDDTDSNAYYDLESNQLKQINCEDEFEDVDLEELVNSEGPQEMLQLMLQEQGDEFSKPRDALPSPGLNPLEGPTMCSCGKLGLKRRSRLLALKKGRGVC